MKVLIYCALSLMLVCMVSALTCYSCVEFYGDVPEHLNADLKETLCKVLIQNSNVIEVDGRTDSCVKVVQQEEGMILIGRRTIPIGMCRNILSVVRNAGCYECYTDRCNAAQPVETIPWLFLLLLIASFGL